MSLRDELAAVLGPGNDDTTAYAQADAVLDVLRVRELDGWLVWSAHNTARLFTDEQSDEARAFASQVLGVLYRIELVEDNAPCNAELFSTNHFRPEQVDPRWLHCDLIGPHAVHENSETGATWRTDGSAA